MGQPPQMEVKEVTLGDALSALSVAPFTVNIYRFQWQDNKQDLRLSRLGKFPCGSNANDFSGSDNQTKDKDRHDENKNPHYFAAAALWLGKRRPAALLSRYQIGIKRKPLTQRKQQTQ